MVVCRISWWFLHVYTPVTTNSCHTKILSHIRTVRRRREVGMIFPAPKIRFWFVPVAHTTEGLSWEAIQTQNLSVGITKGGA